MVLDFSKQTSNYNKQNIADVLNVVPDAEISKLLHHPKDTIRIEGDIHRSQMSSDNPYHNFWFKISGKQNGKELTHLRSYHIFVCFRLYQYNYDTWSYEPNQCVNPDEEPGKDIADISKWTGFWEYTNITRSHK